MSDTETIRVEGASEPERGTTVRGLPVVTGLIGLGLGVALVAIFTGAPTSGLSADEPSGGQQIVSPDPIPGTPATVEPVPEPTLADLAPMLDTDLIGVGTDIGGSSTTERWRLTAEAPQGLDLPSGNASTDVSGRWLALVTQARYSDDRALWVGNPVYAEPLSASVLGAVWSSDEAATIAWTEPRARSAGDAAQTELFTQGLTGANLTNLDGRTAAVIPGRVEPVWFTSAGVVVSDPSGTLSLVTTDGDLRSSLEVERFYAATDRYALLDVAGRSVLVGPTLEIIDVFGVDVSECAMARFAPPGDEPVRRVAIECQYIEGYIFLHVWEISEGAAGLEIRQASSLPQLNLSPFSWASEAVLVASLPVNAGRPETLLTVWDVTTGGSELIRWPGLMYQVVSSEP
jgi:hypothetical protein